MHGALRPLRRHAESVARNAEEQVHSAKERLAEQREELEEAPARGGTAGARARALDRVGA